jgi:dihydroorotate dehydrogenase electron transfer subunit
MKNLQTIVLSNQEISPGYFRMRILAPGYKETARPGQFIMFRVRRSLPPLLRRPFGIFQIGTLAADCEGMPEKEFIELIYKVVGSGTEVMRELHNGDQIELLGPLGRGFEIDDKDGDKILVGGGIGLVPLYMLADSLADRSKTRLLIGGRSRDDIITVTEFERLGVTSHVTTEDGSLGEAGLITRILERKLDKYPKAKVYSCGPMPMLRAVEEICSARKVSLQVSLEALMACGVGACLGCVVKGREHSEQNPDYLCTCSQGPVFHSHELDWGRLEKNAEQGK